MVGGAHPTQYDGAAHMKNFDSLDWNKQGGLLPVIVQDANSLQVLMLGYMNREALEVTRKENFVTFYSRSKQRLWKKGETSGHVLSVVSIEADCDNDTLLIQAVPAGPTCHLNRPSCFESAPENFIGNLDALLEKRQHTMPEGSYTTKLFQSGVRRIAQKVGEEGVETALAAVAQDDKDLLNEASDLVYHLMVLLRSRGLNWSDVQENLKQRHQ
jgi:phosphoribosyl-AMP cyclohydrolase / phosphoribosyl-ATP pyrophosphohydrolase